MQALTGTAIIPCSGASAIQTIPGGIQAVQLVNAIILSGNAAAGVPLPGTPLTVVTAAPAAGQIQFTGTPEAPTGTLTLSAAPTANVLLFVTYVPVGTYSAAV